MKGDIFCNTRQLNSGKRIPNKTVISTIIRKRQPYRSCQLD